MSELLSCPQKISEIQTNTHVNCYEKELLNPVMKWEEKGKIRDQLLSSTINSQEKQNIILQLKTSLLNFQPLFHESDARMTVVPALEISSQVLTNSRNSELITQVLDMLQEGLLNSKVKNEITHTIRNLIFQTENKAKDDFYTRNIKNSAIEILGKGLTNQASCMVVLRCLRPYLNNDNLQKSSIANGIIDRNVDKLAGYLQTSQDEKLKIYIASLLLDYPDKMESAKDTFRQYFKKFDLDMNEAREIFTAWQESFLYAWKNKYDNQAKKQYFRRKDFHDVLIKNCEVMDTMEKMRPGVIKTLHRRFGICDFGRYKPETLIVQFDNIDNKDDHYGVVIFPKADWNGNFYSNSEAIENVRMRLKEKRILMRITENANIVRIFGSLSRLDQDYNASRENKILFGIIGGHGSKDEIRFGSRGLQGTEKLRKTDFKQENENSSWQARILSAFCKKSDFIRVNQERIRKGIKQVKNFFIKNPEFLFISCFVGKERGLVQAFSSELGEATGATSKTSLKNIAVNFDENKVPRFSPVYSESGQTTYINGK